MTTEGSRIEASPSPPPDRPVALTPGFRAAKLQDVYAKALAATIKVNSPANFGACFPTPAQYSSEFLEGTRRQLNEGLERVGRDTFDSVLEGRDVVRDLNEWDRLIGEAQARKARAISEGVDTENVVP